MARAAGERLGMSAPYLSLAQIPNDVPDWALNVALGAVQR
jgi:hypothetical protein